jgi:hypothetical protein
VLLPLALLFECEPGITEGDLSPGIMPDSDLAKRNA